jgi:hypothetical protein
MTEGEVNSEAKLRYDSQPTDVLIIPEGCVPMDLSLSDDERKAGKQIAEALNFRFKMEEVIRFETNANEELEIAISSDTTFKWEDITITFIDDNEVLIQFPQGSRTRDFVKAGFSDRRSGKPVKAWSALLEAAENNRGLVYGTTTRRDVEKRAQDLRNRLRNLFPGISKDDDPVKLNPQKKSYDFNFNLKFST